MGTKESGIQEFKFRTEWTQLPWFSSDTSAHWYDIELSPSNVLTAVTCDPSAATSKVWQYVNGAWSQIGNGVNDKLTAVRWTNGTLTALGATGIWKFVNSNWTQVSQKDLSHTMSYDTDAHGDFAFVDTNGNSIVDQNGTWSTLPENVVNSQS